MIAFKRYENIPQIPHTAPSLWELLLWVDRHIWPQRFLTLTRVKTPAVAGESGVHPAGRGIDVRTWDIPDPVQRFIVEYINVSWDYGDDGAHNVAVLESDHIHFQVSASGAKLRAQT